MSQSIAERVAELVRIPSVNPLQAGPRSGDGAETPLVEWMADRCTSMGADVTLDEVVGGRSNVYARFEGESDKALTVDVHLDTVGVEHMTRDPFDGAIEDGRVYGRGSVDTKATLAVVLSVLEELARDGRRTVPTLNLVGTVSEEMGGFLGAERYAAWLAERGQQVDRIIVAEPTSCAPVHGHKGTVGLEIAIQGHAAHSAMTHLGENSISAAARVVAALDVEHERLASETPSTPVGLATIAVTEIAAGLGRNIIPDHCDVYADRRVVPGEDPDAVFSRLTEVVAEAARPASVEVTTPYGRGFSAFYEDADSQVVELLSELGGGHAGTADYCSNALMYGSTSGQVVVFGPGSIDQAHQAVEWVEIAELEKAVDVYRSILAEPTAG
ncbi:MAG: M20/M25/M40 family metallo-hydrolase [Acidimicrobiales bacterium]